MVLHRCVFSFLHPSELRRLWAGCAQTSCYRVLTKDKRPPEHGKARSDESFREGIGRRESNEDLDVSIKTLLSWT